MTKKRIFVFPHFPQLEPHWSPIGPPPCVEGSPDGEGGQETRSVRSYRMVWELVFNTAARIGIVFLIDLASGQPPLTLANSSRPPVTIKKIECQ